MENTCHICAEAVQYTISSSDKSFFAGMRVIKYFEPQNDFSIDETSQAYSLFYRYVH